VDQPHGACIVANLADADGHRRVEVSVDPHNPSDL
jgi:hypothetical protein